MNRYEKVTTAVAIAIFVYLGVVVLTLPRSVTDPDLRLRIKPYRDVVSKHLDKTETQIALGKSNAQIPSSVLKDYDIYDANERNPFHAKTFPKEVHSVLTYVNTPAIDEFDGIWLVGIGLDSKGQAIYATWLRPHYIYGKHK